MLADRSDISEELVRLRTHAAQLEDDADGDGEVGKRLDFLLQEMNREVEHDPVEDRRPGRPGPDDHGPGAGGEVGDR